jgi:branched-chain amino acid transport system substrate-binding protein
MKNGIVAATVATLAAAALVAVAPPVGASRPPLKITFISSLTGLAASQFADSQNACTARVDLQNAEGGVNGRKIDLSIVDDQTNPSLTTTAVQGAVSGGAVGIVANSPLFFLAAKYAQQAGVPVTGNSSDGPEWGEQPYTNMFDAFRGSEDPKEPVNSLYGKFLKEHGGTIIGAYGYGVSPLSAEEAKGATESFQRAGGRVGVLNTTVPFGGVDFTSDALVAKQQHINALLPTLDDSSNFALVTALKQAGVKLKAVLFSVGYEPSVVNSSVWPDVQGTYFLSLTRPFSVPDAGTEQMAAALQKYGGFTKSEFPSFGQDLAWLGCDLMIKGMQNAGANPTRAGVIKALRSIKSYNGNGLLPLNIDYSTVFGKDLPQCAWILRAEKSGFVPISPKPLCGTDFRGTSLNPSS